MATKRPSSARVRPLLARPGAHYTCFGDGLCCTDLHGLGPLTRSEVKFLRVISPGVIAPEGESGFDEPMLRLNRDGGCLFLGPAGCELHHSVGAESKPDGCRRFPLGLAATPAGGRITTRHRCTCRTLGKRPPLSVDGAENSLSQRGRLQADRRIGSKVRIGEKKRVSFERYAEIEAELLQKLEAGEDALDVLDVKPFPKLKDTTWKKEADDMVRRGADDTRFGTAIEWFARSIKSLLQLREPNKVRPLSWAHAFDRAMNRAEEPGDPDYIAADWVADEIWGLQWTELGSFARARADIGTRYAVAKDVRRRLEEQGRRPDRAAAEAVTIADLMGDSEWWDDVVEAMVIDA